LSVREIARTGRSVRTILRCYQAWTQEGREHRTRGTGSRRMTTELDSMILINKRGVYISLSLSIGTLSFDLNTNYKKILFIFKQSKISIETVEVALFL
jgi:hypothetical protein